MQNVQNAAEIQQRVINLVELYRTKVGKESHKAKELAAEYKEQYDREIDMAYTMHEQGFEGYILDIQIPEEDTDFIRVNEQLLGHFYKIAAQGKAEKKVAEYFLAEKYDSSIFTDEEESFLASHFAEMVNYIIQTPNNDLSAVEGNDRNDLYLLPAEVLSLIQKRVAMPSGSKIYNPFTGFAQLPHLYKNCTFFCEESYMSYFKRWNEYCDKVRETEHIVENKVDAVKLYAWMRVALFANNLDVIVLEDNSIPQNYDAIISYIPYIPSDIPNNFQPRTGYEPSDKDMLRKISQSYQNLADGGKIVLILPTEYLWEKKALTTGDKTSYGLELGSLWKQMIDDHSLVEIIQLPSVMGKSFYEEEHSIIIAEKGHNGKGVSFMDTRFASIKSENILFNQALDLEQLHSMIEGEGKEMNTGLRKLVHVSLSKVNPTLLVPQVYVIEKPLESEKPVPLTELSSLVTSRICDVKEHLPEDTPWIKSSDLSEGFCGTLDIATIQTAGCPNNPEGWSYGNRKLSNFLMGKHAYPEKDIRVSRYRNCKYIDGRSDAVLFKLSNNSINVAIIEATGKAVAISSDIHVLLPIANFDAISIAAMLKNPIVYRQLAAYEEYGFYGPYGYLKEILVPTDELLIYDEKHRLSFELKMRNSYETKVEKLKNDQQDKLCNYQHGMRKHIREISSAVRRMERFINEMDSPEDIKAYLLQRLGHIKDQRQYLSDDIERLNDENIYGERVPFDIDHSLRTYNDYFGTDTCNIKVTNEIANEAIRRYLNNHQDELKKLDEQTRKNNLEIILAKSCLTYVDIAEYNFGKIVRNILENAKKHGFDDFSGLEHKDCKIEIVLKWDEEREMYRIDFRNNGNPLPDGLSKDSYGENRKYAGKTGGTGIGGYEVAENVKHYDGDYSISQDGGWVVVSIYLPKSKKYEQEGL